VDWTAPGSAMIVGWFGTVATPLGIGEGGCFGFVSYPFPYSFGILVVVGVTAGLRYRRATLWFA